MKRAIKCFSFKNQRNYLVIIDGKNKPNLKNFDSKAIIKGDQKSISIAAASIIAKIYRDRLMKKLSKVFPQYKWEKNKGYGTPEHIEALKSIGICKHHRKTFKPIINLIHSNSKYC